MSARFDYIISSVDSNSKGVADIGTDHGYIPILLAKSGFSGNIIASDINCKPLNKAKQNALNDDVSDKITFILSDGLSEIDRNAVDTVIICGMGSELICRILDNCDWILDNRYSLILQPASRPEVLVYWLDNNGFRISEDRLIEDNGRICRFIRCRFEDCLSSADDVDLYCGIKHLCMHSGYYYENLLGFRNTLKKVITGLDATTTAKRSMITYYNTLLSKIEDTISEVENGSKA